MEQWNNGTMEQWNNGTMERIIGSSNSNSSTNSHYSVQQVEANLII